MVDFVLPTPDSLQRSSLYDLREYEDGLGPRCISYFGTFGPLSTPVWVRNSRI